VPQDEVIIDLTNFKDRVGSRVPAGRYTVVVQDAEAGMSNNNNPTVTLWLRIRGGAMDGSTLVDRLTLTEKAQFRAVAFMQALGLPTPNKRLRVNIRNWVGKVLDIDVEDGEPYQGRVKSEVRGYLRTQASRNGSGAVDVENLEEFAPVEPVEPAQPQSEPAPEAQPAPPAAVEQTAPAQPVQAAQPAQAAQPEPAAGGMDTGYAEVDLDTLDL
jgi:Protein of unknown function (DUF669)